MKLEACRKWLVYIWLGGFLIPFALILIQYASGKYGAKTQEVLGWLTALTLPTILLMIGVIVAKTGDADEKTEKKKPETVAHEKFVFKLAVGVSLGYLLIINLVFFLEPYSSYKPQELMRDYKVFLAGFDSLISLLIGYFFGKK